MHEKITLFFIFIFSLFLSFFYFAKLEKLNWHQGIANPYMRRAPLEDKYPKLIKAFTSGKDLFHSKKRKTFLANFQKLPKTLFFAVLS